MNEAQDNVKQPAHYTYGDIEIIDFIEQVTAQYPPELKQVEEFESVSERGAKGFGSSGV
ncbi:DUF3310 domain-containing protein [Staphylococcus aureus]